MSVGGLLMLVLVVLSLLSFDLYLMWRLTKNRRPRKKRDRH